jgi:hypothetical protein
LAPASPRSDNKERLTISGKSTCRPAQAAADLLAHTSPLGWSHINLTGDYLWEQAAIAVDGFRPLNVSRSRLKPVA